MTDRLKQTIYLVVDDYKPEPGSVIYGAYTTYDIAFKAMENLADPDGPYGGMEIENLDIRTETLTDDPTYI